MPNAVQVIIREVDSLKRLVDEFSRFARLPEIRLEDVSVNRILENTLSLYDGRIQDVRVWKELDPDIPNLSLDPEQMKRVFINLFDNALEAMAKNPDNKVLHLQTSFDSRQKTVRIEISDTGAGFPEEYQDSMFLPLFLYPQGRHRARPGNRASDRFGPPRKLRAEPNAPVGSKIIIDLPLACLDSGLLPRAGIPTFVIAIFHSERVAA